MNESITYPAIAISEGDSFLVVDEEPNECSYYAWQKNGYLDNFYLFDSAGCLWRLSGAEPTKPVRFFDKLYGRVLTFNMEFSPINDGDPMPQTVSMLVQLVKDDPDDLYNQFLSHDELINRIRAATSPKELIALAGNLGGPDEQEEED